MRSACLTCLTGLMGLALLASPVLGEEPLKRRNAEIRKAPLEEQSMKRKLREPRGLGEAAANRLRRGLQPADQIPAKLETLLGQLKELGRSSAADAQGRRARQATAKQAQATLRELLAINQQLARGFRKVEQAIGKDAGDGELTNLTAVFADMLEDLESEETLGNMEIQDLMSRYNQAEQLAGSVFKKKDDADLAIINKI